MAFSFLFADVTDRIFKWHMERNINVTHYICDIRYLKYYDEEPDAMKEWAVWDLFWLWLIGVVTLVLSVPVNRLQYSS